MPFAQLPSTVLDATVRGICRRPYPNHPKGCPNFGKRAACPPEAPKFADRFDVSEVWAIWNVFDFGAHCSRMRDRHPEWSQRQVECCLYWQGTARKQLEGEIEWFVWLHPGLTVTRCPEAMGVNITGTLRQLDIELEWPPQTRALQVALAARENH